MLQRRKGGEVHTAGLSERLLGAAVDREKWVLQVLTDAFVTNSSFHVMCWYSCKFLSKNKKTQLNLRILLLVVGRIGDLVSTA